MVSKVEQGRRYRFQCLKFLIHVGYATTRQIALAVFGSTTTSAKIRAGRTINWLLKHGYVVERRNDINAERLLAITKAGVDLSTEIFSLPDGRAHARDWLRHAHPHRTMCNSVFSSLVARKRTVWSELEIRAGAAPTHLCCYRFRCEGEDLQKIPDLILEWQGSQPVWIEVENTWRCGKDFDKLLAFMRAIFGQPNPVISKILFVIASPGAKSIGHRIRAALTHNEFDWALDRKTRELDAHILKTCINVYSLNLDTLDLAQESF